MVYLEYNLCGILIIRVEWKKLSSNCQKFQAVSERRQISIPSTVLNSLWWRRSETAWNFWQFQLSLFSLHRIVQMEVRLMVTSTNQMTGRIYSNLQKSLNINPVFSCFRNRAAPHNRVWKCKVSRIVLQMFASRNLGLWHSKHFHNKPPSRESRIFTGTVSTSRFCLFIWNSRAGLGAAPIQLYSHACTDTFLEPTFSYFELPLHHAFHKNQPWSITEYQ